MRLCGSRLSCSSPGVAVVSMCRADRKLVAEFPGIRRTPSIAADVEPDGYVLLTGKVRARRRFVVSGDLVVLLIDSVGGWCSRNRACFFSTKRVLEMEDDTVSYLIDSKTVMRLERVSGVVGGHGSSSSRAGSHARWPPVVTGGHLLM